MGNGFTKTEEPKGPAYWNKGGTVQNGMISRMDVTEKRLSAFDHTDRHFQN